MVKVIGVRFRTAGRIYFFDPLQFEIKRGDNVIVETARGIEFGTVVAGVHEVEEDKVIQPLKPVIRVATERDKEQEAANKGKEKEALKICHEKILKHGLEMKLIDAEYTFDNNKVLFYFTADGRIDFRELVKDLASVFKTRIELRQIGVRDETKILGGIGICGRPLCCHSYLADFVPVSIKMAKEQNLSLNPTKISGVCGRLMCCLKNEEETYEDLNRRLPNVGDTVLTDDHLKGEVKSVNVLRQLVKVLVDIDDDKELREYEVKQLSFKSRHNKKDNNDLSKDELDELARLEQEEKEESSLEEASDVAAARKTDGGEHHSNRRNQNGVQKPRNDNGEQRQGQNRKYDNGEQRQGQNGKYDNGEQRQSQNGKYDNGEQRQNQNTRHDNSEQRQSQNRRNENNGQRHNRRYDNGEQRQNQNHRSERNQNRRHENGEQHPSQNHRNDGGERHYNKKHQTHRNNKSYDNGQGKSTGTGTQGEA